MATRAYNELYLANAQTTLATLFDYAVNFKGENIDRIFAEFVASGISDQIGIGNPNVITGKSGIELYEDIKGSFGVKSNVVPYYSIDRTPEFWFGYYIAYAQWFINRSFRDISFSILPSEMLSLYSPYHEMNPQSFAEFVEQRVVASNHNLRTIRVRNGYGQTELANLSGVELRNIQSFEQCKNNISKAQFDTINSLSTRLNCNPNDLTQSYDLKQVLLDNQIKYIRDLERKKKDKDNQLRQIHNRFNSQQQQWVGNYITQFPFNNTVYYNNEYYINTNVFDSNLQNYWNNIQQGLDFAKFLTDYKPVKVIADSFGALNAKNLIELAYRLTEIINDINNK